MENLQVNIDFKIMETAMREHVRSKAIKYKNTIVYMVNGKLIEEDPLTLKKTILNENIKTV